MKRTNKIISVLLLSVLFFSLLGIHAFAEVQGQAAAATPIGGDPISLIVVIVLFALVFYFFMYRPQKKQEKEVREMRESLTVGDEVVTTAGIIGSIVRIKDDIVTLELGNDRTKIKVFNWAIREVILPANADEDAEPKKVKGE